MEVGNARIRTLTNGEVCCSLAREENVVKGLVGADWASFDYDPHFSSRYGQAFRTIEPDRGLLTAGTEARRCKGRFRVEKEWEGPGGRVTSSGDGENGEDGGGDGDDEEEDRDRGR